MKDLFPLIKERLLSKEPLVLATVTESSGSTPRGAGARMLAGKGKGAEAARLWGTVGGGLAEHKAIEEAGTLLRTGGTSFRKYLLHPNEAADIGAKCGGEYSVFARFLDAGEPGLLDTVEKGLACFAEQKAAWLVMEVRRESSGGPPAEGSFLICTEDGPGKFKPLLRPGPACLETEGKLWFSEPLVMDGLVYVFGGGHIAQELVPLLARLGFRCAVFDDREEFTGPELFPGAEKIILGGFDRIGAYAALGKNDYAVVVTRGHLWDLEAWAFALKSPAAYIGVIGSVTKHEFVKARLRERGFTPGEINAPRVHAPIGVDIRSETPAEIAVSIAGELILERAKRR
jgi:xanthine dehydrogenase accessory factor